MVGGKVIHKTVPERFLILCSTSLAKLNCKSELKATFISAIINIEMMVD